MTEFVKERIEKSAHRETYLMMDAMAKTGRNYLFNIEFVSRANEIIARVSPGEELLDTRIVNGIFRNITLKIDAMGVNENKSESEGII